VISRPISGPLGARRRWTSRAAEAGVRRRTNCTSHILADASKGPVDAETGGGLTLDEAGETYRETSMVVVFVPGRRSRCRLGYCRRKRIGTSAIVRGGDRPARSRRRKNHVVHLGGPGERGRRVSAHHPAHSRSNRLDLPPTRWGDRHGRSSLPGSKTSSVGSTKGLEKHEQVEAW